MDEDIVQLARSLPRQEFLRRYRGLFLAIREGESTAPAAFKTTASVAPAFSWSSRPPQSPGKDVVAVLRVAKKPGNPYPDRISVGRARNCDLVIVDSSVSKLHAHFLPRRDGGIDLVDLGSRNGTLLNGQRLAPNQPEPVVAEDAVQFGSITGTLHDAAGFLGIVSWL